MRTGKHLGWLALLLAATLTGLAAGQQPPDKPDKQDGEKSFEKNLDAGLREVINLGAMIFNNQGDYAGCFRVYEGALLTTRPLLGKYPDLQKAIDQGLAEANSLPRMHDRAHALRRVIDEIRYTMSPDLRPRRGQDHL